MSDTIEDKYPNLVKVAKLYEQFYIDRNYEYEYDINDLLIVENEGHFDIQKLEVQAGIVLEIVLNCDMKYLIPAFSIEESLKEVLVDTEQYADLFQEHNDFISLSSILDEMFDV